MLVEAQTADEITDELEDLNKGDVKSMGVDGIMNHLNSIFSEQVLHTKSMTMRKYEEIKREPNESLWKYYNRYRCLEKKLSNCGISVGDPELRAFRFLGSAKISTQVRTNILTSAGNKFDLHAIYSAIQTLYPQRRDEGGQGESSRPATNTTQANSQRRPFVARGASAPSRSVRMAEVQENDNHDKVSDGPPPLEVEEPDPGDEQDNEEIEPEPEEVDALVTSITSSLASSVKDVLATVTANKLKEKTLGRGWSQGSKRPIPAAKARLSREEMMKVHPCSICMKFGHWSRECSQNPNRKTSGEVEQTPREVRFTALADSARRPGQDNKFFF